ncbi:hypothetical protein NDU88_003822 [Pleurodeles waltl]|uniref:Secreted protein n=1 Tax=Pleurodeles waltl TaxID=8319 RepID=A0AAV7V1R8_PLEWA|nr:hypothetical protein NDU88_003822 [Pleurodeles waltl]
MVSCSAKHLTVAVMCLPLAVSACLALHRQSRAFFSNVRLSRRSLLRSASRFNAFPQKSSACTDASLR